jgi:hypothetical protein
MSRNPLYIISNTCITDRLVAVKGRVIMKHPSSKEFKSFGRELYKKLACNYSRFYKMDNLCKLAFLGVELLVKRVEIVFPPENTAILLANFGSTIDTDRNFLNTLDTVPSPAIFVYTLPNIAAGEISIRHGWKGENLFLIADRFNAKDFADHIEMLFADSDTEFCIAGWVDYFSEADYKAFLWLITNNRSDDYRKFDDLEIASDFGTNE